MRPAMALLIRRQLTERDHEVLRSLLQFRLLTSRHLQQLHFTDHQTDAAALRACSRSLQRICDLGLIKPLERRIGGVRRGSASLVWHLAATGEHYLRSMEGDGRRRRFLEPSLQFVRHTLAVNDVAVALRVMARSDDNFMLDHLGTEPSNWRPFLGAGGETTWLKPDLHVITSQQTADGLFESHTFLEMDLGTEHLPRIQTKCRVYAAYAATGAYQAEHGLFPAVVWLSADPKRRARLRAAVAATAGLPPGTFRVRSPERYLAEAADE